MEIRVKVVDLVHSVGALTAEQIVRRLSWIREEDVYIGIHSALDCRQLNLNKNLELEIPNDEY